MRSNSEISFYVDTMIVEALLSNPELHKTADSGFFSSLVSSVQNYVTNQIDPSDAVGSILEILAPGVISVTFSAFGFPLLGTLIGFAIRFFNIDVKGMWSSMWQKLKQLLGGSQQISSSEIDRIVNTVVDEHNVPATPEEAANAQRIIDQKKTSSQQLREAKLFKLAMIEFSNQNVKNAAPSAQSFMDLFSARKPKATGFLGKVFGWILKVALASAGLMLASDVVSKFLGRPGGFDKQKGKLPTQTPAPAAPVHIPTQTKFKVSPGYSDAHKNAPGNPWVETIQNNKSSIENMLVGFAKQVYQGLDGLESIIIGTPGAQVIADRIAFYNHTSEGDNLVYLPTYFTSKKQIVDMFIDDVAERAKQ